MTTPRLLPPLLLLGLFALLALAWATVARAASVPVGDLISERGFVRDAAGLLTVQSVQGADFKPLAGPLGLGNKGTPTWLKLVVPPQPADRSALVLVLQPAAIEAMQIYLPRAEGGWLRMDTGSELAFARRGQSTLNFATPFTARSDAATVLYVRLQTFTGIAHAQVLTPDEARDFDTRLHVAMGLYLGFALVMALLSATLWASSRQPLWGLAALFDVVTLAQVSLQLGLAAKYVLPQASGGLLPGLFYLSGATHLLAAGLLWSQLLRLLDTPRWAQWGYLLVVPTYAFWLVLLATGHGSAVPGQVNLGVLLLTLWGLPVLWVVRPRDALLGWLYRVLTLVLVVYLLHFVLPILRAGQSTQLSLYPTLPSNLVTMVLVVAILARRTLLDLRERGELQRQQQETTQRLHLEQAHHAETAGMLGMIMHEVKNPLASIRMASELLRSGRSRTPEEQARRFATIEQAVEGIDTVLQRCIDMDRLEHGALEEHRQDEDVNALLRHWLLQHRDAARLQLALPESLHAKVDARLLLLLLGNLVENALRYSPPKSAVRLQVQAAGPNLEMTVRNAVGRAGRPDPHKVFTKYYRSAEAQHGSGTGLGLHWVQQVSEMIGGRVFHSPEADDVVFTLVLPR